MKSNNFDLFGELLNQNWIVKKELSNKISNIKLDEIYSHAIKAGATGGKLLGAGGGGFLLFYDEKENQLKVTKQLSNLYSLPIKFDDSGTRITYYDQPDI